MSKRKYIWFQRKPIIWKYASQELLYSDLKDISKVKVMAWAFTPKSHGTFKLSHLIPPSECVVTRQLHAFHLLSGFHLSREFFWKRGCLDQGTRETDLLGSCRVPRGLINWISEGHMQPWWGCESAHYPQICCPLMMLIAWLPRAPKSEFLRRLLRIWILH